MSIASNIARRCLEESQEGVVTLEHNQTVGWINPALAEMLNLDGDSLIGQNRESIADGPASHLFADDGVIHVVQADSGTQRWLKCRSVVDTESDTTIKLFSDVTELFALKEQNQHLHQQVEELTITDELTGLANRRALTRALNAQVTRSRRYNNPLCLAIIELRDNNTGQTPASELVLATSRYLRDRLRWVDVIARWDQAEFVIILPETQLDAANDLLQKVHEGFAEMELPEGYEASALSIEVGLAQWQKGYDGRRLMSAAHEALAGEESQAQAG